MSTIQAQKEVDRDAVRLEAKYTRESADVEDAEREHIFDGMDVPEARLGLAISGGGIRSASFGLGLLQALVGRQVLERVDYLSTVSGGGYIGSSLTWFLHLAEEAGADEGQGGVEASDAAPDSSSSKYDELARLMGTREGNFPFGSKTLGGRGAFGWRNAPLDYIRQHGRYLTPGEGLNFMSLVGLVVRSMGASLFIYGGLLTAAMAGLIATPLFDAPPESGRLGFLSIFGTWLMVLSAASITVLLLGGLAFGIGTRLGKGRADWRYRARNWSQRASGYVLKAAIAFTLLGLLPLSEVALKGTAGALAGGSTVVGGLLALIQSKSQREGEDQTGLASSVRLLGGAGLLLFGLLLGSYEFAKAIVGLGPAWGSVAGLTVGGAALILGLISNINYLNLHRMYRDRLMETFLPNFENVMTGKWGRATEADKANMAEMCRGRARRPYHLINTNLVTVDSNEAKYRGRGGDSFLISPLYCGSDATGWRRSDQYMMKKQRGMTLPTAMAISGAAANPNSGVAGAGPTRTRLISALMSLLNLRLGYWAPNPREPEQKRLANFIIPGLPAILGRGLSGRGRMVELSDGGHFENLGLYELIRRRVECIIVSDAGCDPKFDFADLANALERVRVDFGVQIVFDEDCDLRGLLPGAAGEDVVAPTGDKWELAARGYATATIKYPAIPDQDPNDPTRLVQRVPRAEGRLYYVKTTLTEGLPADLYGYKQAHRDFPDESTADQFFDEKQFEAYRELGYRLGSDLLLSSDWEAPA